MATREHQREHDAGPSQRGWFRSVLLSRHGRTLLLGLLTLGVLALVLGAEALDSAQHRPGFLVAMTLAAVLLGDNLFNIWSSAREHRHERLFIENEFIEAQAKLDLLVRWLDGRGVRVDLDQLALQALTRQMSARHANGPGARDGAADRGPDTVA